MRQVKNSVFFVKFWPFEENRRGRLVRKSPIYEGMSKKSDAQVGRVNTFHILQNIRKGPLISNFV
jgi:hypothetical protein